MKIGDDIRPIGVPVVCKMMKQDRCSRRALAECSPLIGIVPVPEIGSELLELHVGEVVGKPAYMHSIWIERELVELIEGS